MPFVYTVHFIQCEDEGNKSPAHCPQPGPPTIYVPGPIALILFFMVLESIGAHGFIAFFGGILLILGFIKLSCGGIICCRKTKQQEYTQKMIDKGVPPKSERFYIMLHVLVNRDPMSPEQILHCTSEHALSHNKYSIIYI